MKLTIERSKWYRGKGNQYSRLLITDSPVPEDIGKMCCLGFCALAMGIPQDWLRDAGLPISIFGNIAGVPEWFTLKTLGSHASVYDFTDANDTVQTSEEEREKVITLLFAKHDIQVEFVD